MRARKAEEAFVERMRGRADRTATPPPPAKPLHPNHPHSQSHPQLEGYGARRAAGVGGVARTPSVQSRRPPKADTGTAAQSPPTLWSASAKSPRLDDDPTHEADQPCASASASQQQYEESMEDAAQELNETASSREHCSRLDSLAHLRLAVTRITVEELRELSEEVDETVDEAGNRFKCRPDYDLQVKVVALICAMALANEPVSVADVLEDDLPLSAWIAAQRALHKPSELLKALRAFPPQIVRWNHDAPWPGPALQAARVFLAQGADEVGDCVLSHLQLWIQAAVLHFDPSMTTYVDELPEPEGLGEAPGQGKDIMCHEESEVVEHIDHSSTPAVTASLFANTKQQEELPLGRGEPLDVEPSLVDDSAESTHEVVAALLRAADTAARSEACVDVGCSKAGQRELPAVASTSTSPLFGDVSSREVLMEKSISSATSGGLPSPLPGQLPQASQPGSPPHPSPTPEVRPCFEDLIKKRVSEVLGKKNFENDGAEMARRENRKPENESPTAPQVVSKGPAGPSLFGQDLTLAAPCSTAVGTVKDTSPPSPPLPEQPAHTAESEDSSELLPSPPHLKTSMLAPDTARSQLSSVSDGPIEHQADWTANSVTFSRDLNNIQRWIRGPQDENSQPASHNSRPGASLTPTLPSKEEALKARTGGGDNLGLSPSVQPATPPAATETLGADTSSRGLRSKALEPPPTWHWKALREVNQILASDSSAGAKGKENCPPAPPQHHHIKEEKKEEDAGQIAAAAGPKPLQAALRATPTPVRSGGSSASCLPSPVQHPAPLTAKPTPPPPPPPSAASTAPTPQRREAVAAPEAREPSRRPEIAVPDVREAARKWELQPSQARGRSSPSVQLKFDDSADLDLLCQELLQKPPAAAAPAPAPAACRAPSAGRRFIPTADTSNPWQADTERSFTATRASSVTPPSRTYLNVSPVYPASSSSFNPWPAPPASLRALSETCTSSVGGGLLSSASGRLDRSADRNPCRTPRQGMDNISRSRNPFQSTLTPSVPRALSQQDISDNGLAQRFQILAAAARTPIHQPTPQQQPSHQPFLRQPLKQPSLQQTQPQQHQWEREQRLAPPTPQRLQPKQTWEPHRLQLTPQRQQQEEQNHRQPLVSRPVLAPPVPRSPADPFAKEDARGGMERLLHGVSRLQQRRMSTPNEPVSRLARGNAPVGAGETITASSSTSLAWRRSTPSTPQVLSPDSAEIAAADPLPLVAPRLVLSPEEAEIAAEDPSPLVAPRLASATTPARSRAWGQQQHEEQQQAFPSAVEEAVFYDVDDEKYLRRRGGGGARAREAGAGPMQAAGDEASEAAPLGPTPWRVSRPPPATPSPSATLSSCTVHDADHRRRYEIGIFIAYVIVLLIGIWCMLKLVGDIALWIGPAPKDYTKRPGAHGNPKLQGYL